MGAGIGIWQVLIVLLIAMLLFGNRLPSIARSLGQSIVEFKKGVKEIEKKEDAEGAESP